MPKIVSDYSNTVIYKITCKDPNIQDVYVGHTVNFIQRKQSHRLTCINTKSLGYNCKVYRVIRNNGGWDNWKMCIIAFYDCKDQYEARQKEQEHFVALNANLNSIEPHPIHLPKPITPNKHHTDNNPIQTLNIPVCLPPSMNKSGVCYNCEPCGFTTDNKTDYERHLSRRKHYINVTHDEQTSPKSHPNVCPSCNKIFKHRTSVYKHKAICPGHPIPPPYVIAPTGDGDTEQLLHKVMTNNQELTSAIMILIQQNTELQSKIMEYCISRSNYS